MSIAVTPASPSLTKGKTLQFKATGSYSDNSTQDITASVAWSSSNTGVATIHSGGSQAGLATAVAAGKTTIQASLNGVKNSATLTVTTATLVSVAVTPTNPSRVKGQTLQFKATGSYSDNSTRDITASVAWSSSNTGIATIHSGDSQAGLATAVAAGKTTIQALLNSVKGSTTLTVTTATLVSLAVTPTNPSRAKGQTLQFKATGSYSDNSTQDITASVVWSSSNTGVATILSGGSQSGLATAVAAGKTTIQASLNGVNGSTTLTVTTATLVSLAVTPTNPSLTKGQTLQFKATGSYSDNSTQDITASVAWSSSSTGVATILSGGSQAGLATAVAAGKTTIQASLNSVNGSTALTVTTATLVSLAVTPTNPSRAKGQTLQFKATGSYSDNSTQDITASVAWSSSNSGVATILSGGSQAGLATAVAAGKTTIQASLNGVSGSTTLTVTAFAGVLTYHNDSARTGQNLDETVLTPSNVNVNTFGKLFSVPVDGYVYAQPLYVPGVTIPGKGVHNVVYVATENDTVYAFDADSAGAPLWQTSLLGSGETAVPYADLPGGCNFVVPVVGITSTPVIDPSTNTIYVVAMSELVSGSSKTYFQRLHALDITTGKERTGSPVAISGTAPGTQTAFDPHMHLNRPGLALVGGTVYVAFGSHCDARPYHGWLFAYDAAQLTQLAVFNTTPAGGEGAIWQAGGAPSSDAAGNIYVITGNGTFDADSGGSDYGDSFLKMSLSGNTLAVEDYFTPFNQADLNSRDQDLGSAGALLLPNSAGSAAHPHLMISAGKAGTIYLVDRDNLGKFCGSCTSTDTQIVQELQGAVSENFSNPAYWQGLVYFGASNDPLRAFSISGGVLSSSSVSASPNTFGGRGTTPSISANGSTNGIVWAIGSQASTPAALLHAYLATNLADELYNSGQAANGRDTAGGVVKFTVPTIASGKVYVGTRSELDVYGLLP